MGLFDFDDADFQREYAILFGQQEDLSSYADSGYHSVQIGGEAGEMPNSKGKGKLGEAEGDASWEVIPRGL